MQERPPAGCAPDARPTDQVRVACIGTAVPWAEASCGGPAAASARPRSSSGCSQAIAGCRGAASAARRARPSRVDALSAVPVVRRKRVRARVVAGQRAESWSGWAGRTSGTAQARGGGTLWKSAVPLPPWGGGSAARSRTLARYACGMRYARPARQAQRRTLVHRREMDDELRLLFSVKVAVQPATQSTAPVSLTFDAAASQIPGGPAGQLVRALQLQPHSSSQYRQLALSAARTSAPPGTEVTHHAAQSVLLKRALSLLPTDVALKMAASDVAKAQFSMLNTAVPGSQHYRGDAALGRARSQWLKSLRDVASMDEGRYSSSVNQNLGSVLQLMGLHAERVESFVKALELMGVSLKTSQARRALTEGERRDAKAMLAALDLSLAHRGMDREAGHRLGVRLGFWSRPDQRPPTNTPSLHACAFHKKEKYTLVRPIEAAAHAMRTEMMSLLRRRGDGIAEEATMWYTDHERIAKRPSQWLRRHVACSLSRMRRDAPKTCEAVEQAMLWYWGAADPGGADAEVDPFYLRAQFSVLGPGAHILPHVGPTNERLAISIGLAGLGLAEIRVSDKWRRWDAGKAIVFDDSFEHEVRNVGSEHPRAVLIVHIPHPQLMPPGTNGARLAEDMASNCQLPGAELELSS